MASNGEVMTGAHSCSRPPAAWEGVRILSSSVSSSPVMCSFRGSQRLRLHRELGDSRHEGQEQAEGQGEGLGLHPSGEEAPGGWC